jgi:hypothetical protein
MRGFIILLAGALAIVGACGCAAPALPPLPAGAVRAQLVSDDLTFTLDSPAGPRVNDTQHLRVTLADARGRPVDGAGVYLDMDMNMLCLSGAKPAMSPTGPGVYEADVVYVMAGDWRVTAVAEVDGRELRATFPIHVAE